MPQKFIKRVQEMSFVRKGTRLTKENIYRIISDSDTQHVQHLHFYNQGVGYQILDRLLHHHNLNPDAVNYLFLLKEEDTHSTGHLLIGWLGLPDISNRSKLLYSISHSGDYFIDPDIGYGIYDIQSYPYMKNRYETNHREIPLYFCYMTVDCLDPKQCFLSSFIKDIYKKHKQNSLREKPDILHMNHTKDLLVFPI